MSSEEHVEEYISSGKDEFNVGQLAVVLKECQALVHPDVDKALANESQDAVASEADWEKFYAIINKLNAPVVSLYEVPQPRAAATVIAAVALGIQIAQILWNIFRGWDDKAVSYHCSCSLGMLLNLRTYQGRSQWTQDLVRDSFQPNPHFNYVVVCTNHSVNFDGVRDRDWSSQTYDYSLRIGRVRYVFFFSRFPCKFSYLISNNCYIGIHCTRSAAVSSRSSAMEDSSMYVAVYLNLFIGGLTRFL